MKKKIVLSLMAFAAITLMGTSCKNAKMECWEYTVTYNSKVYMGYIWDTQDYMDTEAAYYKQGGAVFSYEKASKYKTVEDCLAADDNM